jgi:hypothetical protein
MAFDRLQEERSAGARAACPGPGVGLIANTRLRTNCPICHDWHPPRGRPVVTQTAPPRHAGLAAEVQRELNRPEHKGKFLASVDEETGHVRTVKLPVPRPVERGPMVDKTSKLMPKK